MEADFTDRRARELRHKISSSVKELSLCTNLLSMSVITQEDATRVREMMPNGTYKANEELMECVFSSEEPGKWKSFLDALKTTGYENIRLSLMSPSGGDDDVYTAHMNSVIRLFTDELAKGMVPGITIVDKLYSEDILSDVDKEQIYCKLKNQGDYSANVMLLDRMTCKAKPRKWYFGFLQALVEAGYEHLVEKVEPEFIRRGCVLFNTDDSNSLDNVNGQEEGDDMSVHEQNLSDHGDGEMDTNDLGAPPVPTRTCSLDTQLRSEAEQVDNNTNLKQLNVKPDMEKNIELDDDGPESEDESSDENSMESDYEETQQDLATDVKPYNLRSYQIELAENAIKGKNTIICSETGTGKTWVALEIIRRHFEDKNGLRKVAYMACTCLLLEQQAKRIERYLSKCKLKTKLITGATDDSKQLNMYIDLDDIICFTPQILVDSLDKETVKSLSKFSLLILDECHHTRGGEPYSRLMRKYLVEKSKNVHGLPQIVGLTASIGVGKSSTEDEAVDYILRVMACLNVRILSTVETNIDALREHVNMPEEETIQLEKHYVGPCKHILLIALGETDELLNELALMKPDIVDLVTKHQPHDKESRKYNKWTADLFKKAILTKDTCGSTYRDICACARYLNTYNSALEINKLLPSTDVIKYLAEKHTEDGMHQDKHTGTEKKLYLKLLDVQKKLNEGRDTENPNVRTLSDTLKNMLDVKGEDSRALVFVKARATCRSLAEFLDQDLSRSGYITRPLYGKETRCGDDGMTESVQTDTLEKFREGFYNVLVCTSVGNEGIDVPQCNIVLSYEYAVDAITKIQLKGRARTKDATSILMGSEGTIEQDRKNAYKAALMYKALKEIKGMEPKIIEQKIRRFQSKEMSKYSCQVETEIYKKKRKTEEEHEILCARCDESACFVSDVREMKANHVVIDPKFADKIERMEHSNPQTYDRLEKKIKMVCKKCGNAWGSIGIRDGLEYPLLQIQKLKFMNKHTGVISMYKKWIDQPYRVREMTPDDIKQLFGDKL